MHTEIWTFFRYSYFNPMEYTVYLIRKKGLVYPMPAWLVKSVKSYFAILVEPPEGVGE